jgi:predicted lipoprotein with Yx(FWY)xxD motif
MKAFNSKRAGILAAPALVGALALVACGTTASGGGSHGSESGSSHPSKSPKTSVSSVQLSLTCSAGVTICTKTVLIGGKPQTVLATTKGMTLYYFTSDSPATIACTGACVKNWPPLTTTDETVAGSGLSGTLSILNNPNGVQVLYNGHPLYTYIGDHTQTDANGEGVGGKWHVATPNLASGSATAAVSPASGGYGSAGY